MSNAANWADPYARQADADLRAWQLYQDHPSAVAAEFGNLQAKSRS